MGSAVLTSKCSFHHHISLVCEVPLLGFKNLGWGCEQSSFRWTTTTEVVPVGRHIFLLFQATLPPSSPIDNFDGP